jgi:maleate isomerase
MIVPSSNTTVEAELRQLLPTDGSVSVHVARLRLVQISGDAPSDAQFEHSPFLDAAALLADAEVDLILWNGTAASWLGKQWDSALVAEIERRTGIRATTAVFAIDHELARLNVRRLGLVTPYTKAVEDRIIANYRTRGIDVIAAERLNLERNTEFAAVSAETISAVIRSVAKAKPEAIVILCTNLAGATLAPSIGAELGLPVIDSVAIAVRYSLDSLRTARHG